MTEATPRPWKVKKETGTDDFDRFYLYDANDNWITSGPLTEQEANLIVRAVNHHAKIEVKA